MGQKEERVCNTRQREVVVQREHTDAGQQLLGEAAALSVAQNLNGVFEVLRPEWDFDEECVCSPHFTSLQATPHPTAVGQHRKHIKKTAI